MEGLRGGRGQEELVCVVGMHVWETSKLCGGLLGVLWPRKAQGTLRRVLMSFRSREGEREMGGNGERD